MYDQQISKDLVLDNIFMRFNIFHAKLAICLTYDKLFHVDLNVTQKEKTDDIFPIVTL
jgi:hypothetical protein